MSQLTLSLKIDLAHDGLDHGGFTLSIFPYKGDLLAQLDGHGCLVEYDMIPIAFAHVLYDHRVFSGSRGWRKSKL